MKIQLNYILSFHTPVVPSMTFCFSTRIQNGESWNVDNCTTATCINGNVTETSAVCPTIQQLICANGRTPVKVYDDNRCCFHYECPCKLEMQPFNIVYHIEDQCAKMCAVVSKGFASIICVYSGQDLGLFRQLPITQSAPGLILRQPS